MVAKQQDLPTGTPDTIEAGSGLVIEMLGSDSTVLRFAIKDPNGVEIVHAFVQATPEDWREIAHWLLRCVRQWEGQNF